MFLWMPALTAEELTRAVGLGEGLRIGGELAVLEDAQGRLSLADVQAQSVKFRPAPATGLVSGSGHGALWLRFTLTRAVDAPVDWWLQVRPATVDGLSLYVPNAEGYAEYQSGDRLPFSARASPSRDFIFHLVLPVNTPQTYYLRIIWAAASPVSLKLWQAEGLTAQAERDNLTLGAFFGVLAFTLLLNGMVWVWLREPLYLAYSAYLFFMGAILLSVNGLASQWLFPNNPLLANEFHRFATFGTLATTAWFFVPTLQLRQTAPLVGRIVTGLALFYLACLPASYLWGYADTTRLCQMVRALLHMPMMLVVDLVFLLRPGFRFYIVAFLPQQILTLLFFLGNLGVLEMEFRLELGTLIHMALLSLALADRVRRAERDRRRAQEDALRVAKESERVLETRVEQRSTELSAANAALRLEVLERSQLQEQLQEALSMQRQFVAMVSHEFRTPLAIIDATAQRLSFATTTVADASTRMEKIRRAVGRMNQLIDNLLAEDRMTSGGFHPQFEDVDLASITREVVEQHQPLFLPPLVLALQLGTPTRVSGDGILLSLSIANLLQNAVKFSPEGGAVTVRVCVVSDRAELSVEDQGVGIPQDCLSRVFERYYRGGKVHGNGAGLGLYLVRQIALAHGGDVVVSSVQGKGSRFVFGLPLASVGKLADGPSFPHKFDLARNRK